MYIILILHIPHASHMVPKIICHLSCTHTVWSGGGLNTLFFFHHSKQTSILYFTQTLSYLEVHDSNLCQVLSLFFAPVIDRFPSPTPPQSLIIWSPSSLCISNTILSQFSNPHPLCFPFFSFFLSFLFLFLFESEWARTSKHGAGAEGEGERES